MHSGNGRTGAGGEAPGDARELIDTLPHIVWTATPDGAQDYANRQWYAFIGVEPGDPLAPEAWRSICHPDDVPTTVAAWRTALQTGEPYSHAHRVRRHDGVYRWILSRAVPQRDAAGRIVRWCGTGTDITDLQDAQQERTSLLAQLRETLAVADRQRREFEAVFRVMNDGVLVFDMAGNVVLANDAEARICGYANSDELKRKLAYFSEVFELATPDGRVLPVSEWPVSRVLRGELVTDVELRGLRRDTGQRWYFSLSGAPVCDADGRQVLAVIITRDVTARKTAEQALRESEERFRIVQEVSLDGFAILRARYDERGDVADFIYEYENPAAARMNGTDPRAVIGRGMLEIFPGSVKSRFFTTFCDALVKGTPAEFESEYQGEGVDRWFRVVAVPLGGRIAVLSQDIGDRKAAEQALKDADRRKDEFLATLAHELRNPLAPMRSALDLLTLAGTDPRRVAQARATMERQMRQMVRLIDDLLDLSRVTTGKLALRMHDIVIEEVTRAAVEAVMPLVDAAGHELSISGPAGTVHVSGDLVRLTQVVTNLLSNAVKYTPAGGRIEVAVGCDAADAVIAVRDNGIGIPPDKLETIFGMFSQVHGRRGAAEHGLGIGLHLARRLVEMHGGSLTARSAGVGHGSVFEVRLPVQRRGEREARTPAEAGAAATPRRIMIVDDNRDAGESLGAVLRMLGHEVCTVDDAPSAGQVGDALRPEIVLLDLGMPRMDGFELARALRATDWGSRAYIAALTGWGQDADRRRTSEAGFDAHFVKPLEIGKLQSLLQVLGRR